MKSVKQKGEGLLGLNHASKTVDVPASLPTPPHNNQEELRYTRTQQHVVQRCDTTSSSSAFSLPVALTLLFFFFRVQESSERASPDGFVPSSSPESVADMEISRYPDLSFIKLEPPSPCPSPPLPMMPCAWGKGQYLGVKILWDHFYIWQRCNIFVCFKARL